MTHAEWQTYVQTITTATQCAYNHIAPPIRAHASRAHLKGRYEDAWPHGVPEVEQFLRWESVRAEVERGLVALTPPNLKLAKRARVELP